MELTLPRLSLADVGWLAANIGGQFILALAQVDDVPKQTVRGPFLMDIPGTRWRC